MSVRPATIRRNFSSFFLIRFQKSNKEAGNVLKRTIIELYITNSCAMKNLVFKPVRYDNGKVSVGRPESFVFISRYNPILQFIILTRTQCKIRRAKKYLIGHIKYYSNIWGINSMKDISMVWSGKFLQLPSHASVCISRKQCVNDSFEEISGYQTYLSPVFK